MNHRLFKAASVLAILTITAATLTACSSATSQTRILQVTQTADACTFGATSIEAGLIKFSVTNESENTNEFYLLAADERPVIEAAAREEDIARLVAITIERFGRLDVVMVPVDGGYTMDHSSSFYLIDPKGEARVLVSNNAGSAALVHDIKLLLK